ncbi:ester cyclase [Curvibacter sp. CHRR-16]|uniref:ester cyclase n=1 Tax=Curvibacter sp. CHRR-16 TaxID=2835872 RepID=UPI001BD9E552|nr:ester cyclase [Curvibacter sp. CHRR-16]MBT0570493.1 ester cyclase [Curvibacter sp. CHRR-16]
MKATIVAKALIAVASVAFIAPSAMAQQTQKEKIRLFYDAFEKSDANLLDKVLAPNWEDIPMNPGQGPGLAGFKPLVPQYAKVFANMKMTNEDVIEEGNKVVVRSTFEATNIGSFAGFPAKGRKIKLMTIDIHEFNKDGLVAKTWHVEDWFGGLYQMGAFDK